MSKGSKKGKKEALQWCLSIAGRKRHNKNKKFYRRKDTNY